MQSRHVRQQTARFINKLCCETRSSSFNKGAQMTQTISQFRKHMAGNNSFYSDLNTIDQTSKDMSMTSGYDRDKLVNLLKNQALALENQNKNLRKEIQRLNTNLSSKRSNDSYIIPYIRMSEQMEIFTARFLIHRQDYEKIDCDYLWLYIIDSSIKVYKTNNIEQQNAKKTYNLKDIKSVQYPIIENNQYNMIIQFESIVGQSEYLFMKFKDLEQRKKWDFALYINKLIETIVIKDKLFQEALMHQISIITKKLGQKPLTSSLYNRRKKSYNDHLVGKQDNHQSKIMSKSGSVKGLSFNDKQSVRQYSRDPSQKNSSLGRRYEKQKKKTYQLYQELNKNVIKQQNRTLLSEAVNDQQSPFQSRNDEYSINTSNKNRKQSLNLQIFPIPPPQQQQISDKTNSEDRINKIIKNLQQKKHLVKCSKSGRKAHPKIVYLSPNQVQLCWKDTQSGQIKTIKTQDIEDITAGQKGPGLTKYADKVNNQNCVVIRTKDGKMIELYDSKQPIIQFAKDLRMLVFNDNQSQMNDY